MNLKTLKPYLSGLLSSLLFGCVSSQSLQMHELLNYRANTPQIVFMDFKITKSGTDGEKVTLHNAILGTGELRPMAVQPATPVQIKAVLKGTTGQVLGEWLLEHPLYRQFEVMNQNGTPERRELDMKEGIASLRFQQNELQKNLELYRIDENKKSTKIFNVLLKP